MDLDLLLALVENHGDLAALDIDHLPGLTFVLGFSHSDEIARLEVLRDHADVNLEWFGQFRIASRRKGDESALFDGHDDTLDAVQVTLVDLYLIALGVLGRAAV